jgi:RNA polymerase sigma factor (sigma-70 family)
MYASTTEQRSRERVQALAEKLYCERHHHLVRIALKNGAGPEDAEEAVNDSFASFIRAFDPDGGAPPLAWVTLTLKRRCWALYRAQQLERRAGQEAAPGSTESGFSIADIPAQTAGVEETIERAEYVLEARERLAALKPAERTALLLFGLGYSYREIAARRDWTYTKTNRSISEGRAALRKMSAA